MATPHQFPGADALPGFFTTSIHRFQEQLLRAQLDIVQAAMKALYPDVAAEGFDQYRHRLSFAEHGGHKMVLLDAKEGRPAEKPVVYLPEPTTPALTLADDGPVKFSMSFTPVAGVPGLDAFHRMRECTPLNYAPDYTPKVV